MNKTTQEQINRVLWEAADTFRGKIDSSIYKDYVLVMLFVKYMSDVHQERRAVYEKRYDGNEERINRAMSRERFILEGKSTFGYLYQVRKYPKIVVILKCALSTI